MAPIASLILLLGLGVFGTPVIASPACATPSSPPATKKGCLYEVEGVGGFTHARTLTFTDGKFPSTLIKSTDTIGTKPRRHTFEAALAYVSDGFLNLKVPGPQPSGQPIRCAEVSTIESDILYASVRTTAIFSDVPGTVHGNFFYYNDSQEIDIEYVTDPKSGSNPHGRQPLQLTNQANNGNPKDATYATVPSPADRTTQPNEYRIDWIAGKSLFYRNGKLVKTFTTNVPTHPGNFVLNNWSSGDPGFTVGPPLKDNIFKIQKYVMYYNRTSDRGTC